MDSTRRDGADSAHAGSVPFSHWRSYDQLRALSHDAERVNAYLLGFDFDLARIPALLNAAPRDPLACPVSIAACDDYQPESLHSALTRLLGPLDLPGHFGSLRRVLIKVGLVQACAPERHITPTPAYLDALLTHFERLWPAAELIVADGSGHEPDSAYLLHVTGLEAVLEAHRHARYVDLNSGDVVVRPVKDGWTFDALALPAILDEVDLFVSLAKLKAHHWGGVTLSMKNLFGVLPGSVYGYPKNPLHWAGIPRAIADIAATCPPDLCLIDGVVGVEGNGPLDGTPRPARALIAGLDPVATDAAGAQLMGYAPALIPQFWFAIAGGVGTLHADLPGDNLAALAQPFAPPPTMPWLLGSAMLSHEAQLALLDQLPFVDPFPEVS